MKQNNNTKNNINIFNYIPKKYSSYVFDATTKYQKKYDFEMGTGNHATWNNEADAFKHAFMQAQLTLWTGKHIAKGLGDFHEIQGNLKMGQSKGEYNMDNWNNEQGREIAKEIIQQYGPLATIPSQKINDIIAEKVITRMKSGKLILSPNDNRKYKDYKKLNFQNQPTGFAANITENQHIFTPQEIGKMSNQEFSQNEAVIMEQLRNGQIKNQTPKLEYENYKNPESGNKKVFTREDIENMTADEYSKYEKEIMAQVKSIGIPYKKDLPHNSKTNYSSNPKDGKWVTINGNHVFIED